MSEYTLQIYLFIHNNYNIIMIKNIQLKVIIIYHLNPYRTEFHKTIVFEFNTNILFLENVVLTYDQF